MNTLQTIPCSTQSSTLASDQIKTNICGLPASRQQVFDAPVMPGACNACRNSDIACSDYQLTGSNTCTPSPAKVPNYKAEYFTPALKAQYGALVHAIRSGQAHQALEFAFTRLDSIGTLVRMGEVVASFVYHEKGYISKLDIYSSARQGKFTSETLSILNCITQPMELQIHPEGQQLYVGRQPSNWPVNKTLIYQRSGKTTRYKLKFKVS